MAQAEGPSSKAFIRNYLELRPHLKSVNNHVNEYALGLFISY